MGSDGQAFLRECQAAGKEICVWTVNDDADMRLALTWGVKAVLTDKVAAFVSVKRAVSPAQRHTRKLTFQAIDNPASNPLRGLYAYYYPWSSWRFYTIAHVIFSFLVEKYLRAHGGSVGMDHPDTTRSHADDLLSSRSDLRGRDARVKSRSSALDSVPEGKELRRRAGAAIPEAESSNEEAIGEEGEEANISIRTRVRRMSASIAEAVVED